MTRKLRQVSFTPPPTEAQGAPSARPRRSLIDLRFRAAPIAGPWAFALAVLVVSAALHPSTVKFGGLATLTPLLGVLIIASLGQSLVIGAGGIDLSVSSVITVVGVVFVMESGGKGGSIGIAIVYAFIVSLTCGLVNGLLVEYVGLSALVSTLATGQILAGLASIWYERNAVFLSVPNSWKHLAGVSFGGGISFILLAAVVLALLFSVVLNYVAIGRRLTAASASRRSGGYLGIRVRRYRAATYVIASAMYALAGILLVGLIGTPSLSLGDAYQLSTIVAVVLGGGALSGGRLHPAATFAGALFLSLINQDVAASGVAAGTQSVIQGAALVAAMAASTLGVIRHLRRRSLRRPPASTPP